MLSNINSPIWNRWRHFSPRLKHEQKKISHWMSDQDFLNCIHIHGLPIDVEVKNVGYRYNYFTTKIEFYDSQLEMNRKIGNPYYSVIHWKGFWKGFYNIEDPNTYNFLNLSKKKRLYRWRNRIALKKRIDKRRVNGEYPFH